jgi:hypothetical protein
MVVALAIVALAGYVVYSATADGAAYENALCVPGLMVLLAVAIMAPELLEHL